MTGIRLSEIEDGLHVCTPAKLNLFLEILRKRDDGFHEIDTIMVAIDLFDELTFRLVDGPDRLTCAHPSIPVGGDNLILKAASLFRKVTGYEKGVNVHLDKRIPAGAGLGGGSGNAAGTLLALNRLAETALSEPELLEMAAQLGSDIPFFVVATVAHCTGRGEIVLPLETVTPFSFTLVLPNVHVDTARVYGSGRIDLNSSRRTAKDVLFAIKSGDPGHCAKAAFNRLEKAVIELHPDLNRVREWISRVHPLALMSGSGSAWFAFYNSTKENVSGNINVVGHDGKEIALQRVSMLKPASRIQNDLVE